MNQADREALEIRNQLLKLQTDDGKYIISTLGVNDNFAMHKLVEFIQNIGNAKQKILNTVTEMQQHNLQHPAKPEPLHGEQMLDSHFRGTTEKGQKFFYCPVGRIVSWSAGDYDHKWCHFEGKYVEGLA